jgi:hypothetical protein
MYVYKSGTTTAPVPFTPVQSTQPGWSASLGNQYDNQVFVDLVGNPYVLTGWAYGTVGAASGLADTQREGR